MRENSAEFIRVAVVSSFPPRRCGIATYSFDLCTELNQLPGMVVRVAAIDEIGTQHIYPHQVGWVLGRQSGRGFLTLANKLAQWADVLLIQHEYGLFFGPAGRSLLSLLDATSLPVVTMLHTVLSRPEPAIRRVTDAICAGSAAILVPGPRSDAVLRHVYSTGRARILQIPHGITETAEVVSTGDSSLLLGFGYLGPNKGVENILAALPYMIKRHPTVRYRFVGSQHPNEVRVFSDNYPRRLRRLAARLGVSDRVELICRYVPDGELSRILGEAAVCVLPYTDAEQAASGTLVRALGAGRAIVATSFRHALEVADQGAVHIVQARDPRVIAEAVELVLADRSYRNRLEERARTVASELRWPIVARRYEQVLRWAAVAART